MTIIDICDANGNAVKPTGTKGQKFWGATVKYILAKENQSFANKEDFKSKAKHDEQKASKDIVYFFEVDTVENANTEPAFYESRINKERTKKASKIKKFKHELGICSHSALVSYEDSEYTRIYEITEKGYIVGIANDDRTIQGQSIKSFTVGLREEATFEAIESTTVEVYYKDADELVNNHAVVSPDFDAEDMEGVYGVYFNVTSASATELVVEASTGCCDGIVSNLELANWKFVKADGTDQPITAASFADGSYTLTGTSLVSGTLSLNGVIVQTNIMYDGIDAKVTI